MAKNSWAQQAGAYYRAQKKTRKDLMFKDALKELSRLRKSGKMASPDSDDAIPKTRSRRSKSKKTKSRSRR